MEFKKEYCLLYAVTDRSWLNGKSLKNQVKMALEGGVTMVQLREKELDEHRFEEEAKEILKLCHDFNVPLLINDNVELARRIGADGVHLGQEDMPAQKARQILGKDKIIGVTAKTFEQVDAAVAAGADYLGSGAVFGTKTKQDAKAMSLDFFKEICMYSPIPVVAIGGITKENVLQLQGKGASGIAVVSGIFAEKDCKQAAEILKEKALLLN